MTATATDNPRPSRREQILNAATELTRQAGPTAASVRAVAAKAGVGASTLRHYFPTQQALSDEVYRHRFRLECDDRDLANVARTAVDRLTECLEQFMPSALDPLPVLRAWISTYHAMVNTDAGLTMPLAVLSQESYAMTESWLAQLRSQGTVVPDDPETVPTLLSRIDGLCLGILNPGSPIDVAMAQRILRTEVAALLR